MIRLRSLALVIALSVVGASTLLWAQKPTPTEGQPTCPPKKQGRAAFPVNRDKGESVEARSLRADLDASLSGDERLHQADLEMQKRELFRQIKEGAR